MPDAVVAQEQIQPEIAASTTEVSWEPTVALSYEDWVVAGRTFYVISNGMPWWMGDWVNYGEMRFGEAYTQAIEERGISKETFKKYKAVAARIPKERRVPSLSWTHHFAVAYIEPAQADKALRIADEFELSVRDLKFVLTNNIVDALYAFTQNTIQLRYDEVMREAVRLANVRQLAIANEGDRLPFDEPEEDGDNGVAWLPGAEEDSVERFFGQKGIGITFRDDTCVIWDGGVRLYVERNDQGAYIRWEIPAQG